MFQYTAKKVKYCIQGYRFFKNTLLYCNQNRERRKQKMKKKDGSVFSIVQDNLPVPGCTISGELMKGVTCFSLAEGTDISAERYPVPILQLELSGDTGLLYKEDGHTVNVKAGEAVLKAAGKDIGVKANGDSVYLEIALGKEEDMNEMIKAGEVFNLKELVPYRDGKIVNMDIINNSGLKFVVMAFDEGCALSEHAAPGDAIVFALDGEGVIGYEGKEYPIKAGENFRFAKGGLHSVKANGRFKMALLLTLE